MNPTLQLSEEMSAGPARLRVDVYGSEPLDHVLGVEKFFGSMPSWEIHTEPSNIDVVIVPAIDRNFDPSCADMIPFERQFQTFHSVQNCFLLNELLAPGFPMPMVDTDALREARVDFVRRFAERPYLFVRVATPQVLLDEVDRVF